MKVGGSLSIEELLMSNKLYRFFHTTVSTFSNKYKVLNCAFKMRIPTIITTTTNYIRILFIIINNGCIIFFWSFSRQSKITFINLFTKL